MKYQPHKRREVFGESCKASSGWSVGMCIPVMMLMVVVPALDVVSRAGQVISHLVVTYSGSKKQKRTPSNRHPPSPNPILPPSYPTLSHPNHNPTQTPHLK